MVLAKQKKSGEQTGMLKRYFLPEAPIFMKVLAIKLNDYKSNRNIFYNMIFLMWW